MLLFLPAKEVDYSTLHGIWLREDWFKNISRFLPTARVCEGPDRILKFLDIKVLESIVSNLKGKIEALSKYIWQIQPALIILPVDSKKGLFLSQVLNF